MPSSSSLPRVPAFDWMRGLVMVLMAVDHASHVFNQHEVMADSAYFGAAGQDLVPPGFGPQHFLTRWVTHLCAPTFVFLAGTVLAMSVERRRARGESALSIDAHLLSRGALLVLLETWMSIAFQVAVLQVLYAIGAGIACMVLLRRIPAAALLALALGWIAAGEAIVAALGIGPYGATPTVGEALLFTNGFWDTGITASWIPFDASRAMALYPLVPWLAVLVLGWCFGRWWLEQGESAETRAVPLLAGGGAAAIAVFLVQRALDGYGNFGLPRTDETLLRWLQVSKYPPSLAYCALELGVMALCLAGLVALQRRRRERVSPRAPLYVFGQTALFFYLVHIHLLGAAGVLLFGASRESRPFGVEGAWLGALGVLVVLYPACLWFRGLKASRPRSVLRYL